MRPPPSAATFVLGLCACAGSPQLVRRATPPAPVAAQAALPAPAAAPPKIARPEVTVEVAPPVLAPAPAPAPQDDAQRYVDVVSERGQRARGLYFNAPMIKRLGARGIVRTVREAGLDAAVIDLKDGEGRVSYDSAIPELQPEERLFMREPRALIAEVKAAGVYVIARITCFSDPVLPRLHPERAVLDGRPRRAGEVWMKDAKRNTWLDPYNEKNHDLIVALAAEAQELGVDEVQLDYIRFPVDEATAFAVFPAQGDKPRREVLLGLLRRVDEALRIPLGVDVFGLAAFRDGDPSGLGQSLEDWVAHVEVFSPMLYVNGMREWMRHVTEGRAGALVRAGVESLRRRVGAAPVIRPFIQAFSTGADYYTPQFIAEQIEGARDGGADGFLFWHPASRYGMVEAGVLGPGRALRAFPIEERARVRDEIWGKRSAAVSGVDVLQASDAGSALVTGVGVEEGR